MRKPKFQTLAGMHDILPVDQPYFQKVYRTAEALANFYRFQKIDTPILEQSELFSKGSGAFTDVVQKEMYNFRTKGGDYVCLRPEGTPPIVRAYIQHGMHSLPQPIKLWYYGPFFRQERPQAGRYREFHHIGFEVLGEQSPGIDVQIIQIFYNILKDLKLKNLIIEVNSLGASCCRPYYRKLLVNYLKNKAGLLCADCRRRLKENPLRILDCKQRQCQRIVSQSPQMLDHLCQECHNHFKNVLEFLDELELPYHLNPYLVRGLDYYTKTVFEIFEDSEVGRAQGSLAGGGRYDLLVKRLGGKETPACGGALGVERVVNIMKAQGIEIPQDKPKEVFLAQLGNLAKRKSFPLLETLRKAKISVAETIGQDSLKAQLRIADRLGVKYTLIFGQKEAIDGVIIIREMSSGKQSLVKIEKVVEELRKRLKK